MAYDCVRERGSVPFWQGETVPLQLFSRATFISMIGALRRYLIVGVDTLD